MMEFISTVVRHQCLKVGCPKHCHQVINNPCYAFIKIIACQVGLWNQTGSLFTTEILRSVIVQSGSKHAIGYCLCVNIRKILFTQILNEYILECIILPSQVVVLVAVRLVVHGRFNNISQQTSLACHQLGQTWS